MDRIAEKQLAPAAAHPRVLFISHETTLSGAPIQLLHLATWLRERDWELLVSAPERGPISDLLNAAEVEIVIEPTLLIDPQRDALRELCGQFDVVVANTIASWPAVLAAHEEKVPVIWYLHETRVAVELIGKISEIRPALRVANLLVTPTRETARIYEGLSRAPIEVVPYGIPELPVSAKVNSGQPLEFVALGSYEPRKGQNILIQALHRLDPATRARTSFKMAGRTLDAGFFERIVTAAADLKNVELVSALDHGESLRLLATADVLICPSRDETMPVTIIEAMSLGKAVIAADVGGIREWIRDEMNGFLVPPENPHALAEVIARCARDENLVRRIGAVGRRTFSRHFRIDRLGAAFANLLGNASKNRTESDAPKTASYEKWVRKFDALSANERIVLSRALRTFRRHPLISILLPVYNADLDFLGAAIDSVRNQIYERWELCIADDASMNAEVRPFLQEMARSDDRIKLLLRETNGHISACSNSALSLATGEWCALLDQDDALSENALAFVALEIAEHPETGLIYSDEDKIDNHGARSNPFFKTDWNPELFLGQNYINHLGVYRTSLLREIGGFWEGFEGSQDYDLALRCVERLRSEEVRHIPRILYHWRIVQGSLAAVVDAKPYAKDAARRAIGEHLKRCGITGHVVPCPENIESHRVIYDLPEPAPLVSALIPTRDRVDLLKECIQSLRQKTDYPRMEIIVVDNDSVEKATHEYLRELKTKKIARVVTERGPFNFSRLINRGAAAAKGAVLALLNNDIEAEEPGWLREMVSHVVRSEVGAVGARLWYPTGRMQHGGVVVGLGGVAGQVYHMIPRGHPGYFNRAFLQQNYSCVTAACMVLRKKVFVDLGGFDEVNLAVNFNDVEFCLRLRERGLQIVWTPYANLIHHESASRGHHRTPAEQSLFFREATYMQENWGDELLHDPFYNPNLSLNQPGFELAFPPRWEAAAAMDRIYDESSGES
ncbi:MAG: glycosyltransferase [Verrucomicrobiota bacterium]